MFRMTHETRYVLLSLPSLAYQLLPLSSLVGTLVGMCVLASSSELTIMRASGLSMSRLIAAVTKPILAIAILALVSSQFGVPDAQQAARSTKAIAKTQSGKTLNSEGGWYKQGSEYVLVSAISSKGDVFGITRYQFDDDLRLLETSYARQGRYLEDRSGWVLSDVSGMRRYDNKVEPIVLESQFWPSELTPDMLTVILNPPMDLPISAFHDYSCY
mgnify:FL=1